jgi:hypothetical protein
MPGTKNGCLAPRWNENEATKCMPGTRLYVWHQKWMPGTKMGQLDFGAGETKIGRPSKRAPYLICENSLCIFDADSVCFFARLNRCYASSSRTGECTRREELPTQIEQAKQRHIDLHCNDEARCWCDKGCIH